ncbi:hypothetical protein MRB53_030977 [Persea americana]|uniref:Uncharacterized protein n=1 Tax=Persea americana TaxID=3435 RepID=A0ACC2KMT3_PERAE|nr:hypothetical protein MRB53_030977 [Persea americana]
MPVKQWTDLPFELLELIVNQLLLVEFLAFRSVCKAWRLAASSCYTTMAQTLEQKPWILFYRDSDDPDTSPLCGLYNESSKKTYIVKILELEGASCIASKEGWLLAHHYGHFVEKGQNHFIKLIAQRGLDLRSWLSKSNEKDRSKSNEKKKQSISFTICGTSTRDDDYHLVIPCEQECWKLEKDTSMEKIHVKAVWVKLCFAQLSLESDYRWTT